MVSALEVWIGIGESELQLQQGGASEGGVTAAKQGTSLRILEQALPFVMPLLLNLLLQGTPEEDEDDSWTPSMAAATCLGFFAQVAFLSSLLSLLFSGLFFSSIPWRRGRWFCRCCP